MKLVHYAYENNQDRKEDGTIDDLRMLVITYCALETDTVARSKEWREMLEEAESAPAAAKEGDFWGEFRDDLDRVMKEYSIVAGSSGWSSRLLSNSH
jgi:hypothetical protein